MESHENLLAGPPPTLLPDTPEPRQMLESGAKAADVAARFPAYSAAWAALADDYFAAGHAVTSYAFARTGYHRGLDQLRRAGWKGHGQIPWEHEPNQGFLRCLNALARAAQAIGEKDEAERCAQFLRDSSQDAAQALTANS
ncbi:DUF3151 domain-containing protein [Microbispora bryophytorum]|jgi:hypothetical protein|uniref:DUF3151 domain-containing protein n=2 Tax=Microbispora bryophytorum TaxID=1460882 RepID=A0A8H9L8D8_9ACTN|nr:MULTISPECIES: DUF3151 domain-containing protein [Microbispora]MBD3135805.1 DUF3151 domain-containing protein [Microbispora bryophytorum]MBD3143388.1 DUF3151 domain-containing protein [Microbispora camponoti]TQS09955.1 DUF3151 domain-containing protein [Microbispora bryophytorum]GGN99575.1 hypothetical protein GCM10011574_05360 [Microbispora bryophytorum]